MSSVAERPRLVTALVTGGTKGIGRAIVERLLCCGAKVVVAARSKADLVELGATPGALGLVTGVRTDLSEASEVRRLAAATLDAFDHLDLLVHAAGAYTQGPWADGVGDLHKMFAVNVQAPIDLTARLLPALRAGPGQVAFINSSQGLSPTAGVGAYAATKHALRAYADSLRQELNREGIRVLTIYPGSTATPMQQRIRSARGEHWNPDVLIQPSNVAEMLMAAITLPRTAEVTDIIIRPMGKT